MEAYKNAALAPAERARDLLERMTLREKTGQLTQRLYGFACYERRGGAVQLTEEFRREADYFGGIGALYGLYRADPWSKRDFDTGLEGVSAPKARNMVQRYLIERTRLGIPALMTTECPHGHQALNRRGGAGLARRRGGGNGEALVRPGRDHRRRQRQRGPHRTPGAAGNPPSRRKSMCRSRRGILHGGL